MSMAEEDWVPGGMVTCGGALPPSSSAARRSACDELSSENGRRFGGSSPPLVGPFAGRRRGELPADLPHRNVRHSDASACGTPQPIATRHGYLAADAPIVLSPDSGQSFEFQQPLGRPSAIGSSSSPPIARQPLSRSPTDAFASMRNRAELSSVGHLREATHCLLDKNIVTQTTTDVSTAGSRHAKFAPYSVAQRNDEQLMSGVAFKSNVDLASSAENCRPPLRSTQPNHPTLRGEDHRMVPPRQTTAVPSQLMRDHQSAVPPPPAAVGNQRPLAPFARSVASSPRTPTSQKRLAMEYHTPCSFAANAAAVRSGSAPSPVSRRREPSLPGCWVAISGIVAADWAKVKAALEPYAGPVDAWLLTDGTTHLIRFRTPAMAQRCLMISGMTAGGIPLQANWPSTSVLSSNDLVAVDKFGHAPIRDHLDGSLTFLDIKPQRGAGRVGSSKFAEPEDFNFACGKKPQFQGFRDQGKSSFGIGNFPFTFSWLSPFLCS